MRCVPQGVALGWVNGCPFGADGAAESATTTLVHDGAFSPPHTASSPDDMARLLLPKGRAKLWVIVYDWVVSH